MSWRNCIQSAIDTGRISSKKGAEAQAAYDEAYEAAIAAGEPEGVADGIAAAKAVEEISSLKAAQRWEKINTMQRAHEIYSRLNAAKDPARELQEIIVDLEMAQETVRSTVFANLDSFMQKFGPRFGNLPGLQTSLRWSDDVVHAAYGDVRSPEAKAHAEAVIEAREQLRKWANMYGANIPENANAKLPQTHDPAHVQKVLEEEWVDDHIEALDWEVMRFGGKEIPVGERREILGKTYRGIVNDGMDRGDIAQSRPPSLGSRLNRDRFLYYKNADSYLAMQKKYGAGNFYEQTINMVEAMAKDISILKMFGPSADSMKEFTKRAAEARAADLNNSRPAGKKTLVKKMERQVKLFEDEYTIHAWHVTSADANVPVQVVGGIRTVAVNALLGSSFIPNFFGDMGNAKVMKRVVGMPEISVFRSYPREFFASRRARAELAQLGVIQEETISLVIGRVRYFGALDGAHWARRGSDITYRLGLASNHTQAIRNAQGKQLLGLWANYADQKFDDLPFAPFLIERGIDAADWDAFRATPLKNVRGAKFLVPLDMWRAGDDNAKKTAQKFMDAMQLFIRTQVPDVSLRSRRALGEWIDPNSAPGQSIRTLGSLMSFPVGIWFNQLRRIHELPNVRDKIMLGTYYFTAMTLAGAGIVQTRAFLNGLNPHDMTLTDDEGYLNSFWGQAVIAGGGLGVVGDLILNSINMNNSPQFSSNPTMEWLEKAHKLTIDNAIDAAHRTAYDKGWWETPGDEAELGADAAKFIDASVPDLWQTKLIFERSIKDDFMRIVDPAGWERKQKYRQEFEQGGWWNPGEEATEPNLMSAVGD